ncbi:MAG: hypothetical protein MUF81_01005 [Verrucomicrobia bacterium]|nr:hypothetical protein [Verrucomicrobiota bacterium]
MDGNSMPMFMTASQTIFLPLNLRVGRAVLCPPRRWKDVLLLRAGAHLPLRCASTAGGVSRPTPARRMPLEDLRG